MVDVEALAFNREMQVVVKHLHSKIDGEKIPECEVVIACDIDDALSGSSEHFHCRQKTMVSSGNDGAVFVPEIEQIADDEQASATFADCVEQSEQTLLLDAFSVRFADTEMHIGDEEERRYELFCQRHGIQR